MVTENVATAAWNTLTRFLHKWKHWDSLCGGYQVVVAPPLFRRTYCLLRALWLTAPLCPFSCRSDVDMGVLLFLGCCQPVTEPGRGTSPGWFLFHLGCLQWAVPVTGTPCQPGQDVLRAAWWPESLSIQSFLPSLLPQVSDLLCGLKTLPVCFCFLSPFLHGYFP